MKRLKLLFLAVMLIATSASAQFVQSGSRSNSDSYSYTRYNAGWNEFTFDIGYGQSYYSGDDDYDMDGQDIYALAFNYARGIHLNRSNGLTLRPGIGMLYGYQDIDEYYHGYNYDQETMFFSLTPKLDFGYHFIFDNSSVSLFPYVGLTTRINAWGEIKSNDHTYDLFDDDEGDANRFQVGMRIGFDAHFNKFVLGLTYEHDFSEFSEDVTVWHTNLKLGWCF